MSKYDKKLVSKVKEFVNKSVESTDYSVYNTFFGNVALIRIFRYDPPDLGKSGLVNADGVPLVDESKRRIIPIGKVLAIGDQCDLKGLKVGDVVALSDNIVGFQENPAFLQYLIETNGGNSRGIDAAAPDRRISNFLTYRSTYGFVGDKIKAEEETMDDFFTFLFPTNFIRAVVDKKKFVDSIEKEVLHEVVTQN